MKPYCLLAIAIPFSGFAQEGAGIKVTTTLHEDGSRTETQTDLEQHTSEAKTFDGAHKLRQRIVYELDGENQPASGAVYAANGALIFKSVYKHDDQNRITEEIDYTPEGAMMRRFVYEFANGKVSRVRAFDPSGVEMQQSAGRPDVKKSAPRRRR